MKSSILIILSIASQVSSIDYCDKKLCPYQGTHIACNNNGSFSSECKGEYKMEDMIPYKEHILYEHNFYRNILASGNLTCYLPAAKMAALVWNDQLAYHAELNAKTCVFAHDKCRSTVEYPYAGENIYYAKTSNLSITIKQFITEGMFLWFGESLYGDHKLMAKYRKTTPMTGHFTLLMTDRATEVGCACLNNLLPKERGKKQARKIIFTCVYSSTNILNVPSYKAGPPGSKCTKMHPEFKSLCTNKINPNDLSGYP